MILKKVGVLSVAKIMGAMQAVIGLLIGLFMGAIFSVMPMNNPDVPSWLAPSFGIGAIVFAPVMYGIFGFIAGAIGGVVYNLFAGMVGGLELHLEPVNRP